MKKLIVSIFCVLCLVAPTLCCAKNVYADGELNIDAKSAILIDYDSGSVLFESDADEKVPVASIVKLMTALITMEEIESGNLMLSDTLTASEYASSMGGSQVFIDSYSEYKVCDMLKSVIVASANDASVALAEKIAGSEDLFVKRMNNKAKELGLNNTVYVNANGLPQPGQYSTARDVALLTREVLKHKLYFEYSTIWMDELVHPSGRKTELVNTNKLIRYYKGCDAGKTGSTDEAGYCLSASAQKNDMRLIAVVLGAQTSTARFNEASKLLSYGFANFENAQLVDITKEVGEIDVLKSKIQSVKIYPSKNYFVMTKKGEETNYQVDVVIDKNIKAPISKDTVCGKITISKDGVVIDNIDVIVSQDIEQIKYKDGLKQIISNWWNKKGNLDKFLFLLGLSAFEIVDFIVCFV